MGSLGPEICDERAICNSEDGCEYEHADSVTKEERRNQSEQHCRTSSGEKLTKKLSWDRFFVVDSKFQFAIAAASEIQREVNFQAMQLSQSLTRGNSGPGNGACHRAGSVDCRFEKTRKPGAGAREGSANIGSAG